jgi:cephalosporin-C deacetylase
MMNIFGKILTISCLLYIAGGSIHAFGQDDSGTVTTDVTTHSSDGIFNSIASYTFEAKSTYSKAQTGKLSYIVTTEAGKKVKTDSIHISLSEDVSQSFDFNIPGMHPGFYKISFMINLTDYDDTTRKAFGVKPKLIISQYAKPADFESFWHQARLELDKVKPEYKVTEMKDSATAKRKVFEVEMKSVDGLTVRGFLTEPINHDKHKKFAVLLGLPGYQVALGPMMGTDPDIAIFTLNIRGSGYSRDVINVRRESYIVLNLEDKNKYILRGAILDCLRAVDFICSRPELRSSNIIAAGGSQGGFLAIATSGLDKRISFCSAANPILSDVRNLVHEVTWPFIDIEKYILSYLSWPRPGR